MKFLLTIILALVALNTGVGQNLSISIKADHLTIPSRVVTVGDIADVTSRDRRVVSKIAELDLDEFDRAGSAISISRNQIKVRAMLAGIGPDNLTVSGPDECTVNYLSVQDLASKVSEYVRQELTKQFGLEEGKITVHLIDNERLLKSGVTAINQPFVVFSSKLPLGENQLQITFKKNSGSQVTLALKFRITYRKQVLVCQKNIQRGQLIQQSDLRSVERDIESIQEWPVGLEECVGKPASKQISMHEVVLASHVEFQGNRNGRNLISRNDTVDAIFVKGPITFRLRNAKVLSPGNIGDSIQIRNPETNATVSGIIQDRSTIVVR